MRKLQLTLVAMTVALAPASWAQGTADTFKVNYYSGANSGSTDATVRITNPGTSGGDLCAMIYVFEPDQQMAECCGCSVTPDGLLTLSVNKNLTANALTGVKLTTGAIKIVSSTNPGSCNPSKVTPTPSIRAWITHLQSGTSGSANENLGGGKGAITEQDFLDATLSTTELNKLEGFCGNIQQNGSGHGVCTCTGE